MAGLTILAVVNDRFVRRKLSLFFVKRQDEIHFYKNMDQVPLNAKLLEANAVFIQCSDHENPALLEQALPTFLFKSAASELVKAQYPERSHLQLLEADFSLADQKKVAGILDERKHPMERYDLKSILSVRQHDLAVEDSDMEVISSVLHYLRIILPDSEGNLVQVLDQTKFFLQKLFSEQPCEVFYYEKCGGHLINVSHITDVRKVTDEQYENWLKDKANYFFAGYFDPKQGFLTYPIYDQDRLYALIRVPREVNLSNPLTEAFRLALSYIRNLFKLDYAYSRGGEIRLYDASGDWYSKDYFYEFLHNEIERATRYLFPTTILLVRMHSQGIDEHLYKIVLGDISRFLKENLRSMDVMGLIGDKMMGIILPQTDRSGAKNVIEKLKQLHFQDGEVSFTYGISEFPKEGNNASQLMHLAEERCS